MNNISAFLELVRAGLWEKDALLLPFERVDYNEVMCFAEMQSVDGLRQSGDIDIFVGCGLKGAMEIARQFGVDDPRWDYKHLHLDVFEDAEVEMHYRVEVLLNLCKNSRLQKWFDKNKEQLFEERDGLVTPTISFNLFYILLHIYRHFLYERVGMRLLMDSTLS